MTKTIFNLFIFFCLFPFASCENSEPETEKIYRFDATMTVDGITRTYLLNLPPNYYDNDFSTFSLVIGMHGTGGKASQFERDYGLTQYATNSKFIVVYPEGVQSNGILEVRTWNAGTCCAYAKDNDIDDVKFIRELIDKLISDYKINPKRVYATGMSNGGMMAYRLACEIPDKITAIAAISCSMVVAPPCNPSRAVPILHIHSVLDTKVPYTGGIGIGGYYFPPIDSVLNVWSSENSCLTTAQVLVNDSEYKFTKWSTCDDGAMIEYYLTQDGGHAWPGGIKSRSLADTPSVVINANDLLWDFFQRFELP